MDTIKKTATCLLINLFAWVTAILLVFTQPSIASEAPEFLDPEYLSKTFQGNLSDMEDILSAREETPKNTELLNAFRARFIERTDGLDLENEDPLIQEIGALAQDYWRNALLNPDQREAFEQALGGGVLEIIQNSEYAKPDLNPETLMPYLMEILEEKGYFSIFGRTRPLLEFMVWKENKQDNTSVELTDGAYEVQVNYLNDFVSKGWSSFATFGGPSTAGWANDDGLFVVTFKWELESESFQVSFLQHETRHFADFELYPELDGPDLEYRAKLTELAYATDTIYDLLVKFTDHAAKVDNAPHSLANWHVITDLSQDLLGGDWPASPEAWEAIPVADIQAAARKLLTEHDQDLAAVGAKTSEGIITP